MRRLIPYVIALLIVVSSHESAGAMEQDGVDAPPRSETKARTGSSSEKSGGKTKSSATARIGRDAELAIALRSPDDPSTVHVLVLSSEPFSSRHVEVDKTHGTIWFKLRAWADGAAPVKWMTALALDKPPFTAPPAIDSRSRSSSGLHRSPDGFEPMATPSVPAGQASTFENANARIEAFTAADRSADGSAAAVITTVDEAAWRGPSCRPTCHARIAKGVVLLSRGLPPTSVDALFGAARHRRLGADTLFDIANRIREQWPSRLVVRSATYLAIELDTPDDRDERLHVDFDPTGRAETQLPTLHGWYLGDERAPALIEQGLVARDRQDDRAARLAFGAAADATRTALRTNPGVARWHARLALSLALQHRANDEAVRALAQAIELAPHDPSIRLIAAHTRIARGDIDGARQEIGVATQLAPDDPHVHELAAKLHSQP